MAGCPNCSRLGKKAGKMTRLKPRAKAAGLPTEADASRQPTPAERDALGKFLAKKAKKKALRKRRQSKQQQEA